MVIAYFGCRSEILTGCEMIFTWSTRYAFTLYIYSSILLKRLIELDFDISDKSPTYNLCKISFMVPVEKQSLCTSCILSTVTVISFSIHKTWFFCVCFFLSSPSLTFLKWNDRNRKGYDKALAIGNFLKLVCYQSLMFLLSLPSLIICVCSCW